MAGHAAAHSVCPACPAPDIGSALPATSEASRAHGVRGGASAAHATAQRWLVAPYAPWTPGAAAASAHQAAEAGEAGFSAAASTRHRRRRSELLLSVGVACRSAIQPHRLDMAAIDSPDDTAALTIEQLPDAVLSHVLSLADAADRRAVQREAEPDMAAIARLLVCQAPCLLFLCRHRAALVSRRWHSCAHMPDLCRSIECRSAAGPALGPPLPPGC